MKRDGSRTSTKLTKDMLRWAYQKWCEGFSVNEISVALDVDMSTLYRIFREKGMVRIRIPLVYREGEVK